MGDGVGKCFAVVEYLNFDLLLLRQKLYWRMLKMKHGKGEEETGNAGAQEGEWVLQMVWKWYIQPYLEYTRYCTSMSGGNGGVLVG